MTRQSVVSVHENHKLGGPFLKTLTTRALSNLLDIIVFYINVNKKTVFSEREKRNTHRLRYSVNLPGYLAF